MTEGKEPAWKKSLRDVADNPDWIFEQMDAIKKELEKDNPSIDYLKAKHKEVGVWIGEIEKFHKVK